MRPDRRNPLDLNNLPEEYGRDGKQIFDESSNNILTEASDTSTKCRKKKSGEKDECGKVYECRFCSLKFCKSQALGGHMNRHRQERETETLDRARQLVFNNDNLQQGGNPHLGLRDINMGGEQSGVPPGNFGDPSSPPYRSAYRSRLLSISSPTILSPTQPLPPTPTPQPYLYPPSSRLMSYSTQYPTHPMSDYVVGHVLTGTSHCPAGVSSYNCIGAPLGRDFQPEDRVAGEDGRQHYGGTQHLNPSSINRFHDGY